MVFRNTKKSKDKFKHSSPAYEKMQPVFSFKDFCKDTKFYTKEHSNSDKNSLLNFLHASKDFCCFTWSDIKKDPQFHAHTINKKIPKLNCKDDYELFQFKLPNHDKGRFVGYFNENSVFCLLIYDRDHQVYERK
jgi:hypothetical protein